MGTFKFRSYSQDLWAGLMFMGLGMLAVYLSFDYPLGKAMRMGPGYFPTYLGYIMTFIGLIIGGRSFFLEPTPEERTTKWALVPLTLMPLSVVVFAVVVDTLGLVAAVLLLLLLANASVKNFRPVENFVNFVVLLAIAVFVFQRWLGVPFNTFWQDSFGKALADLLRMISAPLRLIFGS
jgi:hypothetical protein